MSNQIDLFQSTHSLRSATTKIQSTTKQQKVSIHALLAECDAFISDPLCLALVSIHALLAECDRVRLFYTSR